MTDDPIPSPLDSQGLEDLTQFLARVPAIQAWFGKGIQDDGYWWVKFGIDIDAPLAWSVVQELSHILNYVAPDDRLPTVFIPVSPPPYMNGGPRQFLSWVIECRNPTFPPSKCLEWLKGRLPDPVDDLSLWEVE